MRKKYSKLIFLMGIFFIGVPMFGECSQEECVREDDYCVEGIEAGVDASKNYTVPYCVSKDVDYAHSYNISSLNNSLSSFLKSDLTTNDMIVQYCTSLLGDQNHGRIYFSSPNSEGNRDWSQTFDSHQSLFVYLLCSSAVNQKGPIDFSEILKGDPVKLLRLQQMEKGKDQCSVKKSQTLDDCDMSIYATEIFAAVMSDIFKIKYAQVFHVNTVDGFGNKKKRVAAFLSGYFNITDEKDIKKFPDTVDVIDSNQQYYKSVLNNLRLLDNSKLAKIAEESGCPSAGDMVGVNFVACALHSSQGNGSSLDPAFPTLFYNELLAYRIFVAYYTNWIQGKLDNNNISNEDKEVKWYPKGMDLQDYSDLQIEAAMQTLHDFEEMNMTYPLHIGLLLYQEKMREFRNKYLPPVVKQFYSLSEKLQNVQLPN